jgi:hypothetical protein
VDRKGLVGKCYYTGIFLEELGKIHEDLSMVGAPPPLSGAISVFVLEMLQLVSTCLDVPVRKT